MRGVRTHGPLPYAGIHPKRILAVTNKKFDYTRMVEEGFVAGKVVAMFAC